MVPCDEVEDIDEMPAMVDSCRSIGPATDAAMVSALAPGRVAVTAMVGKSTLGSAETGSSRKPNTPNAMIDAVNERRHHRPTDAELRKGHRSGPGLGRARRDRGSLRQQQLPVDHDVLAAGQS